MSNPYIAILDVRALLGESRKDDSGDFTKGAGLPDTAADIVLAFTAARPNYVHVVFESARRELIGKEIDGKLP